MGGPSTVFDKSALQSLSMDEAVWFDEFCMGTITPMFYVETLADLELKVREGDDPEKIVRILAAKTPPNAAPNVHHSVLIEHELYQRQVIQMDGRPIVSSGTPKQAADGSYFLDFEGFPEAEALDRWQKGEFIEIERTTAKQWREDLAVQDHDALLRLVHNIVPSGLKLSSLSDVKFFIDGFISHADRYVFGLMLEVLGVPLQAREKILAMWKEAGSPQDLASFAPYSSYVFSVQLLYLLGIDRGFISGVRSSNSADMAYLFYLPFCKAFVSGDNLHKRTVPLFLRDDQSYVSASDLKSALREFDDHYDGFPEEVKKLGVMRFASSYPPGTLNNEITRVWDKSMRPDWRDISIEHEKEVLDPSYLTKKMESSQPLTEMRDGSRSLSIDEASKVKEEDVQAMFIKRTVQARRGKWNIVPPDLLDN